MKINNYKVGTTFEIGAGKKYYPDGKFKCYGSFGVSKNHLSIFGVKPEDFVNIKATIIEEDVIVENLLKDPNYNENQIEYFGHISFEDGLDKLRISMIYPNIKLYFVCFPYGPSVSRFWNVDDIDLATHEIKNHKGDRRSMTVKLKVEEI